MDETGLLIHEKRSFTFTHTVLQQPEPVCVLLTIGSKMDEDLEVIPNSFFHKQSSFSFLNDSALTQYLKSLGPCYARKRSYESPSSFYLIKSLLTTMSYDDSGAIVINSSLQKVVEDIKLAISTITNDEKDLFLECHKLLKLQEKFIVPTEDGIDAIKVLERLMTWLLSRMNSSIKEMLRLPTGFCVRLVWDHMVQSYKKSEQLTKAKNTVEPTRLLAGSMMSDLNYFKKFINDCLVAEVLLEYLSYTSGHTN